MILLIILKPAPPGGDAPPLAPDERDPSDPRAQPNRGDPLRHGQPGEHGDPQPLQQQHRGAASLHLNHEEAEDPEPGKERAMRKVKFDGMSGSSNSSSRIGNNRNNCSCIAEEEQ